MKHAGEPVVKKRKHTSDNLQPTIHANWGLPKQERPKGLCVMPQGEKFQVFDKKDDTEYPARQRSFHSSPGTLN